MVQKKWYTFPAYLLKGKCISLSKDQFLLLLEGPAPSGPRILS
jgi:hypothetical protein